MLPTLRGMSATLGIVMLAGAFLPVAAENFVPRPQGVDEVQHTLSTLHLFRGLQLTVKQIRALHEVAREAEALREEYLKVETEPLMKLKRGVEDYIDRLLAGTVGDGLEDPAVNDVYMQKSDDRARQNDWLARLLVVEKKAEAQLNQDQLRIVSKFTKCLVAPLYMSDPERVGQVGDGSKWIEVLDEVRALDGRAWESQRAERIEFFLFGVEGEVGPLAPLRRERLAARCERVFEKARSLSNIMYRLRKNELANFLDLEEQERMHLKKLRDLTYSLEGGPGPVTHWLLSSDAIALYPRLEEAIARGVTLSPLTDLDKAAFCFPGADGLKHCSTATLADLETMP